MSEGEKTIETKLDDSKTSKDTTTTNSESKNNSKISSTTNEENSEKQNSEVKTNPNSKQTALIAKWEDYRGSPKEIEEDKEVEQKEKEKREEQEKIERKNSLHCQFEKKYLDEKEISRVWDSVLLFQKYAVQSKCKRILNKLKKNREKKIKTIKELIQTEEKHVNDLNDIINIYMNPLNEMSLHQSRRYLFSADDYRKYFMGLNPITTLTKAMLHDLKNCRIGDKEDTNSEVNPNYPIADIFLKMAPFFKMYRTYGSRRFDNYMLLNKICKNGIFVHILSKMNGRKGSKNDLSLRMLKPMGRIFRYKYYIEELYKYTNANEEKWNLKKALKYLDEENGHMTVIMKYYNEMQKLVRLENRLWGVKEGFVVVSQRRMKKEGVLLLLEGEIKTKVLVHLFNDILLVLKSIENNKLKVLRRIELNRTHVNFCDIPKFVLQIKLSSTILAAQSIREREEWVDAIFKERAKLIKLKGCKCEKFNTEEKTEEKCNTEVVPVKQKLSLSECIEYVKKRPTVMLKYMMTSSLLFRRLRKPHLRRFNVSQDETKIEWRSSTKRIAQSSVLLRDVVEILIGQQTAPFKAFPKPVAEHLSFSLLYGKGVMNQEGEWTGKSLDLICMDKKHFSIWTRALRFLISESWSGRVRVPVDDKGVKTVYPAPKPVRRRVFKENGDAFIWGIGNGGALGNGSERSIYGPRVVRESLMLNVKKIFCGRGFTHFLLSDGSVNNCGDNSNLVLGHVVQKNDEDVRTEIKRIEGLQDQVIVDIAVGNSHSFFLDKSGSVWACGMNENGVFCENEEEEIEVPKVIIERKDKFAPIIQIMSSNSHFGAITEKGKVITWGSGAYGQLGHGIIEEVRNVPKIVEGLKKEKIIQSSFGDYHSIVLNEKGLLFSFGDGRRGQLGVEFPEGTKRCDMKCLVPTLIKGIDFVKKISCGAFHSGAIAGGGVLFMWGSSEYGQTGFEFKKDKKTQRKCVMTPKKVSYCSSKKKGLFAFENEKFVDLSCSGNHSLALVENEGITRNYKKKEVFTFGSNLRGLLGYGNDEVLGKKENIFIPKKINFFDNKDILCISSGGVVSAVVCRHQWVPDKDCPGCMECNVEFSFIRRRHHCRCCGGIFCNKCTGKEPISNLRMCEKCKEEWGFEGVKHFNMW